MRTTTLYKICIPVCLVVFIGATIVSCKKVNDWDVDSSHNRLFSPSSFSAGVDGVTVTFQWNSKPKVNSYILQLSKDSLQFGTIVKSYSIPVTATSTTTTYKFQLPDLLDPQTQYSARIKGVDTTNGTPESQWTTVAFKTTNEQIMYTVTDSTKTPYTVTLKWKVPNAVTHFMLTNNSTSVTTRYDIADSEKIAGSKTITGLTPEKSYTAVLYYNTNVRGSQTFTLPADLPTGANVVYVGASDNLVNLIRNVVSGTMFVLRQGTKYTFDSAAVVIPDGVSFTIWGEAGANKPIIAFNGFTLGATDGAIRFENLDLTGYQNADPTQTKRNYIFNQSTASTTRSITFENCTIHNFANSVLRLQAVTTISIDTARFDNCIIYDIGYNGTNGTYAFIHNSVASKINNIYLTNNTFYNIGYGIILHSAAPSQTVQVNNNTFYNTTGDARLFIDYGTQTAGTTSFSFANNIIGKTASPAGTAKGIRATPAPIVPNSYQTSDCAFTTSNPITGITAYTGNSAALFTDPANGNFLILDVAFAGKSTAGDPRWRR